MTLLPLLLTMAMQAAPLWLEAEAHASAEGMVQRLDSTARDFGAMARDTAAAGAFVRLAPGARLEFAVVTEAGTYEVWVRAFTIDGRTTSVLVDGREVGATLGGPDSPALQWSMVGRLALGAGPHKLVVASTAGNAKPAYVDAVLLAEPHWAPLGRSVADLTRLESPAPGFRADFETLGDLSAPWRANPTGDQWLRVVESDGRRLLRVHNGSGAPLTLTALQPLALPPGSQVRISFRVRKLTLLEGLVAGVTGVGQWSPMVRRDWQHLERVFLVPAGGPFLPRLTFLAAGDTELDDLVVGPPEQPVSPYETGRFLPPPLLSRAGRLFELERHVVGDEVTTADVDGDGQWALCRLARDENVPMFSRGTVLKSDSQNSPPLRFRFADLPPGPYSAWLGDTGRPATAELSGCPAVRCEPGRQTSLGRVVIGDSPVELQLTTAAPQPHNPGPVYADYLLLIPVENQEFVQQPIRERPATAVDGVGRARVAFTADAAGVARGGVPLPPGQLGDPDHARVLVGGREAPSDRRCLSRWPDGSVQWLLVTAAVPAGAGLLEYGGEVRATAGPALSVTPSGSPVGVTPSLTLGGETELWRSVVIDGRLLGPLRAELTLVDGTLLRPRGLKVTTQEQGALRTVTKLTGNYAAGDRAPLGLEVLLQVDREQPQVVVDHRFIALGPSPAPIRSLHLELETPAGPVRAAELTGEAGSYRLVQDGSDPYGNPSAASWRALADGRASQGERAGGWVRQGDICLAVDDFWQQWPIGLAAGNGRLIAELWPADARQGPFVANVGMAKSHRLVIGLGEPATKPNRLRFDRDLLLQPGVLEPMAGGEETAAYDALVAKAYDRLLAEFAGYGMENWGDLWQGGYVRGAKTWSNQEWDLTNSWLAAYARTGLPRYLEFADAAARHFAEVDCVHAGDAGELGGARTHCHTAAAGHQLEGPNMPHSGWIEGLLLHYGLTGEERSLRAALGIADWTLRMAAPRDELTPGGPAYPLAQSRGAGWPLTTLMLAYRWTGRPDYLRAARRIVDYQRRCQLPERGVWEAEVPHEHPWRGGCVFAFTNFRGLRLYRELSGDELADRDRLRAARWLVGELWRPPDRFMYEQCPTYDAGTDVGFLMWEALAEATRLSGDPLYLMLARDAYERRVALPDRMVADMVRSQWSNGTLQQAPRMLAAAQSLPERPAAITLEPPAEEVPLGDGGTVSFRLNNASAEPLTDLRVTTLIRGDWLAEIDAPDSLAAGQSVPLGVRLRPPAMLARVAHDNDRPYLHLVARFRLAGRDCAVRSYARASCRLPQAAGQ